MTMDKDYNSVPMRLVATMAVLPGAELEALRKDAARWIFLQRHWFSIMQGQPLHIWIGNRESRPGGITAALDYAMNYHQSSERHIA